MAWPYGMAGPRGCLLMLDSRLSCIDFVRTEGTRRARSGLAATAAALRSSARQVGHLQNTPPYWIADLPPSYAVATAAAMAPDCQLPPPYSAVADVHAPLRVYSDINKPASESTTYIGPPPPPPPACVAAAPDTVLTMDDAPGSPLHVPSNRTPGATPVVVTRTTAACVGTDTCGSSC